MSTHHTQRQRWFLVSCALSVWPDDASAHAVIGGVTGFPGGLLHPLLVPAHAMAIAALGLLISRRDAPERRALIAIFAAGLAGAVALVALAFATDYSEIVLLAAALAGALAAAANAALPFLVIAAIAIAAAMALQFDSVPSTVSISETLLTLSGAAVGALIELTVVASLAARAHRQWQHVGIRIAA